MERPLVSLTLAFCLGIFFASLIKVHFLPIYILTFLFLIFVSRVTKKRTIFNAALLILVFLLGLLNLKSAFIMPADDISNYFFKSASPYAIKGIIENEPQYINNRAAFLFKTEEIHVERLARSCSGNITVYVKSKSRFFYGEELLLYGNLYPSFRKDRRRLRNYNFFPYHQGRLFVMNVKNDSGILKFRINKGFPVKRFAIWLKGKVETAILKHTSTVTAGILNAMILGEKRSAPWFVSAEMMKTGTVHILVVSGFNVGIVVFIVIILLKLLRFPRRMRFFTMIPCLVVYCFMTGSSTPVVRATVMAVVFIIAHIIRREPDIPNSLCIAALFILAFNPLQLFDIGFQLSFASVISIIYLYPRIKSILRAGSLKNRFLKLLLDSCLVSFAAWIGTLGFIAYYFRIFSPVTVLANIIIVPLATLITLCGFSMLAILPLAQFLAPCCEAAVLLLLKANALMLKLPAAYFYLP